MKLWKIGFLLLIATAFTACNRGKEPTPNPETDFEFFDDGITKYNGTETSVVIPSQLQGQTVASLAYMSFASKQLTSVTIPNSVTMIWESAFENNRLASVTIPDNVAYINHEAFKGNPLASITIGANVELGLRPGLGETGIAFSQAFDTVYNSGGKQKGTYTLNNGVWSLAGGEATSLQATPQEFKFYVNYIHHAEGSHLAGRSAIEYGDGSETIVIYSNVELHEFKIFNIGADFLNGDVNFTRDVLLPSTYLEYSTQIPEGMPAEAVYFKTFDETDRNPAEHYYWLGYSGMYGTVVAMKQEGIPR